MFSLGFRYHRISDQIGSVLYKDSGNERRNIGPVPSLKNKKRFKIKPEGGQKCVLSRIISFHKICTLDGRIKYAKYLVSVPIFFLKYTFFISNFFLSNSVRFLAKKNWLFSAKIVRLSCLFLLKVDYFTFLSNFRADFCPKISNFGPILENGVAYRKKTVVAYFFAKNRAGRVAY